MARIAGVNIPTQKRVSIALTYIHGIGRKKAVEICGKCAIPDERRSRIPDLWMSVWEMALGDPLMTGPAYHAADDEDKR